MKLKLYRVVDIANGDNDALVRAKSYRGAAVEYLSTYEGLKNPRLSGMFADGKDGRVYQTGYVCGPRWLKIAEMIPMQREVTS